MDISTSMRGSRVAEDGAKVKGSAKNSEGKTRGVVKIKGIERAPRVW